MTTRWLALAIGSVLLATGCAGQEDDERIRLVVPFAAGTVTDTVARALAPCMSERFGTEMVVENRPGEQGALATREFVAAGMDGRALLVTPVGPPMVAPLVNPEVGYDLDDFHFIGVARSAPPILFTAAASPFDTIETLLESAAPVEVAHSGAAMTEELALAELNAYEDASLQPLRVDSEDELLRGVVAGDYPVGLTTITADHLVRIEAGEIRVLVVGGEVRPDYLTLEPTFRKFIRGGSLPEVPIDTVVIAPMRPSDRTGVALSDSLEECLSTPDVHRAIGANFVPDEFLMHGDLLSRYRDLQSAVKRAQNRPKVS